MLSVALISDLFYILILALNHERQRKSEIISLFICVDQVLESQQARNVFVNLLSSSFSVSGYILLVTPLASRT